MLTKVHSGLRFCSRKVWAFSLILILASFPSSPILQAGVFEARPAEDFVRGKGSPETVSRSFAVQDPAARYTLRVYNGGRNNQYDRVSSAIITLNGVAILVERDFNQQVSLLTRTVTLLKNNTFTVELRSKPGSGLTIEFVGTDNTPPKITASVNPPPNAAGWNNTNVTVTFTCSGATSGIASCTSPVTVSTEGDNQVVTGTAVDGSGNTATTSVTVKVDKTPPVIQSGLSPEPNSRGWNNSDVTVSFTATDGLSGVATVTSPVILRTEGANQIITGTAIDIAGNSVTVSLPVNLDKTPPIVSFGAPSPVPNAAGWNNTNVSTPFTVSDALSGVASTTPPASPLQLIVEGPAVTGSVTVTDVAGNTATLTSPAVKIDKTPPVVTANRSPDANANGWNNSDVTAHFVATDALSGIQGSSTFDATVTAEGTGQLVTHSFADIAGNSATATVTNINIDKTPPLLTFDTVTPAANAAGWNNTNVSFPFTASDSLSGVASTTPSASPLTLSSEGPAVTGTVTVTDVAGNTETFTSPAVKIDKTAPLVITSRSPDANANGWNNSDVTAHFSATDALSGIQGSASFDATVTAEGTGQSVTHTFTDLAGNSTPAMISNINIDKTPPTLSFDVATPPPNAAGWNSSGLSIPFIANDALSGVGTTSVPSPLVLNSEGAAITGVVTVTDKAGNGTTFTTPAFKIDKTPPSLTFVPATPSANPAGWNNTDVSFFFTASDALSGVATSTPSPLTLSEEGAAVTGTVTATDVAGNLATFTTPAVRIDKTPPAASAIRSPDANSSGWNNGNVTVSFAGTDGLSGIASCSPAFTLTSEGASQSASGTCTVRITPVI